MCGLVWRGERNLVKSLRPFVADAGGTTRRIAITRVHGFFLLPRILPRVCHISCEFPVLA